MQLSACPRKILVAFCNLDNSSTFDNSKSYPSTMTISMTNYNHFEYPNLFSNFTQAFVPKNFNLISYVTFHC